MLVRVIFFAACIIGNASFAQAAAVTNLSSEDVVVQLKVADGLEEVIIESMRTWRKPGDVIFEYEGNDYRVLSYEEYAIWENGTIGPQRALFGTGFGPLR